MYNAPPATLKTTMILQLNGYPDSLPLSDINVSTLNSLLDDIASGRYHTLLFPEYEKIYQRNPQTALNVEGHIKQLVEEGFRVPSYMDARAPGRPAQCFILGGVTPACVRRHLKRWIENGFARRFLWATFSFKSTVIADSIERWKKLELNGFRQLNILEASIPYSLTREESRAIRLMIKHQTGQETPFVLLQKIACVLKHKDKLGGTNECFALLEDFAESLTAEGAILTL